MTKEQIDLRDSLYRANSVIERQMGELSAKDSEIEKLQEDNYLLRLAANNARHQFDVIEHCIVEAGRGTEAAKNLAHARMVAERGGSDMSWIRLAQTKVKA